MSDPQAIADAIADHAGTLASAYTKRDEREQDRLDTTIIELEIKHREALLADLVALLNPEAK